MSMSEFIAFMRNVLSSVIVVVNPCVLQPGLCMPAQIDGT
jgi:hypothetical protein